MVKVSPGLSGSADLMKIPSVPKVNDLGPNTGAVSQVATYIQIDWYP